MFPDAKLGIRLDTTQRITEVLDVTGLDQDASPHVEPRRGGQLCRFEIPSRRKNQLPGARRAGCRSLADGNVEIPAPGQVLFGYNEARLLRICCRGVRGLRRVAQHDPTGGEVDDIAG
ncbi:hypothetical protein SAMN05444006_1571 [Allgaiera indica]|uniref:Uncharacterized protein n=1 Tax=Allgaiera indica TaxID=765699 RepID=A0A1H3G1Y8_9RHOB|nr:hypothetical protein SAMN05444006_1571 [Allgaiera indica]